MQVIGFSTKFYTLWEVNTFAEGNNSYTRYSFVKNISFDLEVAKAKYPEAIVNLELRGHRSFVSYDNTPVDDGCFRCGQYKGQKISECTDYSYMAWYFNNPSIMFERHEIEKVLVPLGYKAIYSIVDRMLSPEEAERINNEYDRVISISEQIAEHGYYDIESVGNLKDDGGDEGYLFRTNNTDIQVAYTGDVKEMYYSGYYYYLPIINGKSKKIKNKTIRVYVSDYDIMQTEYWSKIYIKTNRIEIL